MPLIAIALLIIGWLVIILVADFARFIVLAPTAKTGFEVMLALGQLFGALVLGIFPDERIGPRLRWAATGLLVLSLGTLGYGYLYPVVDNTTSLGVLLYGSLLIRTLSLGLIAIGFCPRTAPTLSRETSLAIVSIGILLGMTVAMWGHVFPDMIEITGVEALERGSRATLPGLTGCH